MAEMDVKTLKGIAVVSIEDGEKVGVVDDAIIDPDTRKVTAFRLSKSGFRSGHNLVAMRDIESIGRDAVMIRDRSKVRDEKNEREYQGRPDLAALGALRVVTQAGSYVGNLSTVHIDQKTGDLTQIEVSGGGLMDMLRRNREIPISDVFSIGSDVLIVSDQYAPGAADEGSEENTDQERPEVMQ